MTYTLYIGDHLFFSWSRSGWLFGAYLLADVFYAPVAARLIGLPPLNLS